MARTRSTPNGSSSTGSGSGSSRVTASGMRLRPRPLLKPPENLSSVSSPVIRKRQRTLNTGGRSRTVNNRSSGVAENAAPAEARPASRFARNRNYPRARPPTPPLRRPRLAPNSDDDQQSRSLSTANRRPPRMVAERSPTPVPLRLRSRSGPGFPPAPHIIRVSTRGRVRHGEGDPGTSSTDVLPSSLRRYRSRHTGNWETATPFFLTLRVENREAALTSDLDHVQFLSRDDHDRLRAFIDEHYPSEEAADVHRDIMRAVRENFEEIRRNMVRRRQAEEERRQRLGEAWLARLSRPRRGAVLRYLPRSPCTICFEDDPVNPVGCESCNQLIGCSACVGKWFGTSNCSELDTNVSVGSNDNHSKCPLCRFPWEREPAVFSATCDPRRKK